MEPELVVDNDGTINWFVDGKYHRDSGPAKITPGGNKCWYQHGKLHREDGPAIILDSAEAWYLNGKRHRLNGPALSYDNGLIEYWAFGVMYDSLEELSIGSVIDQ